MILLHPVVHLARVTLETTAPLSLSSGRNDGIFDTHLVRDANGLPVIPGTALAGVLRHLIVDRVGTAAASRLFGELGKGDDEGHASRVTLTHGHLHDQTDRPVDGLQQRLPAFLEPLAKHLSAKRDHVRINRRGTADGSGKFDRALLPAGHRFTFDLSLQSDEPSPNDWRELLAALTSAAFRLGGATRSGYGAVEVKACRCLTADLRTPDGLAAFAGWPGRLDAPLPASTVDVQLAPEQADCVDDALTITLVLSPEAGFRIGQPGATPLVADGKPADAVPYTEKRVVWENGRARESGRQVIVPASSVKGVLRHRTAFHHARLTGRFASRTSRLEATQTADDGLGPLFGDALSSRASTSGQAGCVWFDDAVLDAASCASGTQSHVSIDRFTGGARESRLFKEELVYPTKPDAIRLRIVLDPRRLRATTPEMRRAFRLALEDLAHGRLALGAASTRGHGYFTGSIHGNLSGLDNEND